MEKLVCNLCVFERYDVGFVRCGLTKGSVGWERRVGIGIEGIWRKWGNGDGMGWDGMGWGV